MTTSASRLRSVRAYAPACIGNVAAGFDVLGAAVAPVDGSPWGDVVEVQAAASDTFRCEGPYAHRVPADPADNLVLRVRKGFEERLGALLPPLAVTLHKGIPLKSGLGSSGASIVAALRALNAWCGDRLTPEDLLELAGTAEGIFSGTPHLDNVAPSLLGGLCLVTAAGTVSRLPFPEDLVFVVVHPELELATAVSRAALPAGVPLDIAVAHAQNLATLVHALHTANRALLRGSLRDVLVEPHRARLVPGFRDIQAAALREGALGCSLSGSGPSIFAVTDGPGGQVVAAAIVAAFARMGHRSVARICHLDPIGARLLG